MSFGMPLNNPARSAKAFSGQVLSVLATLISPLIAVCLTQYLHVQEKQRTTFALPIQYSAPSRNDAQHLEPRAEPSLAKDSSSKPVGRWQAFPQNSEKQALSIRLIRKADETKEDQASQYMLLQAARNVAIQATDGQTAFDAIDAMAATFSVNADSMKMAVLTKLAAAAKTPVQHKSIAEQALTLGHHAASQDQFIVANRLGKLALAEAKRALDKELVDQARGQIAEVTELVRAKERHAKQCPP